MAVTSFDFLSKQSEKFILSIRLVPGGLSFSGYNPDVKGSFFYKEEYWKATDSDLHYLVDFFYANDFLSKSFRKLYIVQAVSDCMLVPNVYLKENSETELFNFAFGRQSSDMILSSPIISEGKSLLYEMNKEIYEFCLRSFVNPMFVHSQSAILDLWRERSLNLHARQLYLSLEEERLVVACYDKGLLRFFNSFIVQNLNEMLYFILNVWKQLDLDVISDQILICGKVADTKSLREKLQIYVSKVDMFNYPTEVYLMGMDVILAPADLIALSICE